MNSKPTTTLSIGCSQDELEWLRHAARLRHQTVPEYVKDAINARLIRDGVDAVLFLVPRRLQGGEGVEP